MVRHWLLPNHCASKTQKKFAAFVFFWHAIKNSSGQMRQIWRRMEMIHPTIGWRRDETGTHKHAHESWILWSVSRVRSKTMHSLSCITSWLPYITLCLIHRFEIFSAPGTIAHGSIRLPPRSLASSRSCSLATTWEGMVVLGKGGRGQRMFSNGYYIRRKVSLPNYCIKPP